MKTIISILLLLFSVSFSVNAQKGLYLREIPNYVKAKNSNFMVVFYVRGTADIGEERSIIDAQSVQSDDLTPKNKDESAFYQMSRILQAQFETIGLQPAAYAIMTIGTSGTEMEEGLDRLIEQVGLVPGYVFNLNLAKWLDFPDMHEKGKLNINTMKPAALGLSLLHERDHKKIYALNGLGISMKDVWKSFSTDIEKADKKNPDYFVDYMEINTDLRAQMLSMDEVNEVLNEVGEAVTGLPDETEFKSGKLLVLSQGHKSTANFKLSDKSMKSSFPYAYEVVTVGEFSKMSREEIRWVLYPKTTQITTSYIGTDGYDRDIDFSYYYVLKDLENGKTYFKSKVDLKDPSFTYNNQMTGQSSVQTDGNVSASPLFALKRFLKYMGSAYGW